MTVTANEYKLPDVGEGLTEAEIVAWRVKVGDVVAVNDVIVEIETAKSIVELPSPYAGEVQALLVAEGETVEVGTPIIRIGEPGSGGAPAGEAGPAGAQDGQAAPAPEAASAPEAAPAPAAAPPPARTEMIDTNIPPEGNATLVGYGPRQRALKRRARKGSQPAAEQPPVVEERGASQPVVEVRGASQPVVEVRGASQPVVEVQGASQPVVEAGGASQPVVEVRGAPATSLETTSASRPPRALAKPLVRRLARDLGVDLTSVTPTGPKGTVSKEDVLAAAQSPEVSRLAGAPTSTTGATSGERETREPIRSVRKQMAAAMVRSAFTAPHVTEWTTIDATATVELVDRLRQRREFQGIKVSPLLVVARASLLALRRTPLVNSTWDDAAQEVVVRHYVNLGIAAATPRGLVVPNVKDAHALSLVDLARELEALTTTAREGRTQPEAMSGGTFTITNVGVFGVDGGTPIINPGESAILCVGAIKPQPWVLDGQVVPRQVMTLSLSFDHRHIDGATGSQFLADVAGIVSDPATALLF